MRIAKTSHRLVAVLGLAALLAGCITSRGLRMQRFETSAKAYETAMRWSDFAGAAGHLAASAPQPDIGKLRAVRIVSYDVKALNAKPDLRELQQVVEIRYVQTDRMRERQVLDTQHWQYDDKDTRWRLLSGLPAFQ